MRGTHGRPRRSRAQLRFIPAHAGNTSSMIASMKRCSVHPRACGEHSFLFRIVVVSHGSSPRMRGTLTMLAAAPADDRFIPAHAGNTNGCTSSSWPGSVHPRACGEHTKLSVEIIEESGSSPRMRGTLHDAQYERSTRRFIPAHAGNTVLRSRRGWAAPVHPRACGEHRGRSWHR